MWQKAKTGGKAGFDKVYGWVDKLGAPVNRLSNKVGAEAFWPTTLDKESDKAARILRSFCKDGFYQEEFKDTPEGIKQKQKVVKKIPKEVIQNAKGLVIFTTMRTGLWLSGSGGAGILIARLPDGSWSPPSGLMMHTVGLGFLAGIDIYDCVMVINTEDALIGFSKLRGSIGGEMAVVAGPVGMGGYLESEVHKARAAPIFSYLKSRGLYAGVQLDGTVFLERNDENERFYGEKLPIIDILQGKVKRVPKEIETLHMTLRAAEGQDVDWSVLDGLEPPPSDFEIDTDHVFGVPDKMDPDPYGVLALEKEGLQLKEAGTNKRASHEAFLFNPSPSSPVYGAFNRNSIDAKSMSVSRRSSWRTSVATSVAGPKEKDSSRPTSTMVDMAVQTDFNENDTPMTSPTSFGSSGNRKMADIAEDAATPIAPVANGVHDENRRSLEDSPYPEDKRRSLDTKNDHHSDDEEEPVIVQTVQTAATPQFMSRARVVSVKKANAPALPPRNPVRSHGKGLSIGSINSPPPPDAMESESMGKRSSEIEDKRPSFERTRSHDSATLVDSSSEKKVDGEGEKESVKEKDDEFHSVSNTPAGGLSPKMEAIDLNDDKPKTQVAA